MINIRVQPEDFDPGVEIAALHTARTDIGAVASFTGLVRSDGKLESMTLEHYPAMTMRALREIADVAENRWPLHGGTIIHRHGRLLPGARIVLVAVASAHRVAAFDACAYLMDWLKTRAPFWKLEQTADTRRWVDAKTEDDIATDRWRQE